MIVIFYRCILCVYFICKYLYSNVYIVHIIHNIYVCYIYIYIYKSPPLRKKILIFANKKIKLPNN